MEQQAYRPGNLFMDKVTGAWIAINEGEAASISTLKNREMYPMRNGRALSPIPLTMATLERCDQAQLEKAEGLTLLFVNEPKTLWWVGIEQTRQQIKTLHELQNWYFLQTGEELNIRP